MAKSVDMDENVKFTDQIKEDVSPVVFINKIEVNPQYVDHFLKAWKSDAEYFKSQPGHISVQPHLGC
jgi:Antibiotic biosynthesis monooxygenase